MKFKSRSSIGTGVFKRTTSRRMRRLAMPQHPSTLSGEFFADAVHSRTECFKRLKAINRLPKHPLSHEVMQRLCGGG